MTPVHHMHEKMLHVGNVWGMCRVRRTATPGPGDTCAREPGQTLATSPHVRVLMCVHTGGSILHGPDAFDAQTVCPRAARADSSAGTSAPTRRPPPALLPYRERAGCQAVAASHVMSSDVNGLDHCMQTDVQAPSVADTLWRAHGAPAQLRALHCGAHSGAAPPSHTGTQPACAQSSRQNMGSAVIYRHWHQVGVVRASLACSAAT